MGIMHEYPITVEIINIATKKFSENAASDKNPGACVSAITIVVGDECGYVSDSIQMYFDVISKGSICENAKLDVIRIKPKLKCVKCGQLFERKPFSFLCTFCGGDGAPTKIGREFYVDSIVISDKKFALNKGENHE
jgi:hydrogenase nickel incorporation protein HypA/HybF